MPLLKVVNPEVQGLRPLFSANAYKTAWTDYQSHCIDSLNRLAADTDYEHMSLVKVIAQTARNAALAPVYNYAALAFSNHFFFDGLRTDTSSSAASSGGQSVIVPQTLQRQIDADFGGMDELRDHVRATAKAMVGSGWVWLVCDGQGRLRVLATYNSGTPFDMNRLHRTDGNSADTPDAAGRSDANDTALYKAVDRPFSLSPIACLSLWEHSYLHDYGVAGKAQYVDSWFEALDWDRVYGRMMEADQALSVSQ